jgi:hypothetical protein
MRERGCVTESNEIEVQMSAVRPTNSKFFRRVIARQAVSRGTCYLPSQPEK